LNVSEVAAALRALIGNSRVSDDEPDLEAHSRDWSPAALLARRAGSPPELPLAVVRPTSTEEVSKLMAWATQNSVPVVAYGAGSDVVRGIEPRGCVVIDMGEMWQIRDLDGKSRVVVAEAGVTGPQLAEALEAQGFTLGHEPQSHDISTVGGWVATKACGQLSSRYGGIENLVVGIEAVLADGTVVESRVVPRRSAGPDVTSLMIGSEGTLGIITAVALKISPSPGPRSNLCLRFDHMTDGVKAARAIAQEDLRPTMLRLYDEQDAMLFLRSHPEEPQGPLMLVSFDGAHAAQRIERATLLAGGQPGNEALVQHWWDHRNDAVTEFRKVMQGEGLLGPHGIVDTIEVSASWTRLRNVYHSIKDALSPHADLVGCHLSHVYPTGACLYFTIGAVTSSDDEAKQRLETWWGEAMTNCLREGGSISHHHGIGRTKASWLPEELGGWFTVLKSVKQALDPNNILNPGALGL
jgi:alkyldihydroxyacetonephosphate synthase